MTTLYQRANQETPMIKFSTFVKNKTNKSLEQLSDKETSYSIIKLT